ncbi:MAG: 16S rRNA (cytosine(967)-C(5))-methyltransferase RsmB [Verrucomicrobia bacterium]|nr:16S rRNA (cytosine(967)-C(5))-methyltransferase RsmB [Verrucomicrobiota bacterium]
MSAQKPREIAARVLLRRESGKEYVETLLEEELNVSTMSPVDRGLCTELVYGTVRWQRTLDWLISRKTKERPQKAGLMVLLRLGLYQLFWLGRVPDHAAVFETVEVGRRMGFNTQAGFLNAILRGYTREKSETDKLLEELKIKDPALAFSQPSWLVQRWKERYGPQKTRELLEWNNIPANTFARVNTLKTDAEKLAQQWQEEGVEFTAKKFDWIPDGLIYQLDVHPPLGRLKSFQQGLFYVQDPSTLLAVQELDPRPDETILDLCAAPGGKATFMAQLMQNRGKVAAEDIEPQRLELIRDNYTRLGITCIETSITPQEIEAAPTLRYDRILIDAPCSNTGVLKRRVDLRWRIRPEELERLSKTQLQLLRLAAPRLKPGGTLIYSTCSLEPEENKDLVHQFIAEQPQFDLQNERELLPFVEHVDGAYVAKLKLREPV